MGGIASKQSADAIGVSFTPASYSPADSTVEGHLRGIDTALPAGGSVVTVRTTADLPTPAAGVITLVTGMVYHLVDSIDLGSDRLSATGPVALTGADESVIVLQTNSASPLLSVTGSVDLFGLSMLNTGAGKTIAVTANSGADVGIDHCNFNNGAADTFVGAAGALEVLIGNSHWTGGEAGFIVSGNWELLTLRTVRFNLLAATATFLKILTGATFEIVDLLGCHFITDAAGQTALDVAAGVLPSDEGEVTDCFFVGPGTHLAGVTSETVGWWFSGDPGIEDSAAVGAIQFDGNTLATTINTVNVWENIAHTPGNTLDGNSERFSLQSGDLLQYDGKETKRFILYIDGTVEAVSGTNRTYQFRVTKGGVEIAASIYTLDYRATPVSVSHMAIVSMSTGDQLRMQVRNTTNNVNVVCAHTQMTINAAG